MGIKKKIFFSAGLTFSLVFSFALYKSLSHYNRKIHTFDVAIKGPTFSSSESVSLIASLRKTHSITFYRDLRCDYENLAEETQRIVRRIRKKKANIYFYETPSSISNPLVLNEFSDAEVRLVYSKIQTDSIPVSWVWFFNHHFDALIVPDQELADLYKKTGITIPIFDKIPDYEAIILPKKVIFSDKNKMEKDTIYTNSEVLVHKYEAVLNKQTFFRRIMNSLIIWRYQ